MQIRRTHSSNAIVDKAVHRTSKQQPSIRLTDLIFDGYEKREHPIQLNGDDDEQEIQVHRNVKEYKDISPFFKIKLYNTNDKKELQMAEEDLYKRYSFCTDKTLIPSKSKRRLDFLIRDKNNQMKNTAK